MKTSKRPSRRQVLVSGGLASGLLLAGAWREHALAGLQTADRAGIAFGTTVKLKAAHADARVLDAALDAAWSEIARVEEAASLFSPSSALSRLNREGSIREAPGALLDMLTASQEIAELTGGAFDVTVQPLWSIYETASRAGRIPSDDEIDRVRDLIGYRNITIEGRSVHLATPGMALTLNGIAQGYATGRCLRVLSDHGIADAFLDAGEIGVAGKREGREPWTAAIADPRHEGQYVAMAHPLSGVLATSGDYGTSFTADFTTHHIFDPKTLRSPVRLASVSVLAQSGAYADALATAMMILEPDDSLALAGKLGAEIMLIDKGGKITRTPAFPATLNEA